MNTYKKHIWEMTEAEFATQLRPGIVAIRQALFAKGLPISYIDHDCCERETHFVNEYADGTKYLIEFHWIARREYVIRQLNG